MSDRREFVGAGCFKYRCPAPIAWIVYENIHDGESDWMLTCDAHRTWAWS